MACVAKYGRGGTTLSTARPCVMDVTPNLALNMYGSPHLIISYLLKGERRDRT